MMMMMATTAPTTMIVIVILIIIHVTSQSYLAIDLLFQLKTPRKNKRT